jgi:hypothetical protein
MSRPIIDKFSRWPARQICVMGDSITDNLTLSVPTHEMWPARLEALLQKAGCNAIVRNWAKSGDKTTDMLARFSLMSFQGWPDIALIMAGVNDPGTYSTAQTTAYLQAMIKWLKFGCAGYVADQTALPADGRLGDRYVVLADSSTTGGAPELSILVHAATITGDYSGAPAQTVWEYRNARAGVAGWGRIALASSVATHVQHIGIVSAHYLNLTAGGDTTGTPFASYDDVTGVRKAQLDAVANESVNNSDVRYIDVYNPKRARILAGSDAALGGAADQHVQDTNQHLNAFGESLIAQFVFTAMQGLPGWINALAAAP